MHGKHRHHLREPAAEPSDLVFSDAISCNCASSEDDGNVVFCTGCMTSQHFKCYYGHTQDLLLYYCGRCQASIISREVYEKSRTLLREALLNEYRSGIGSKGLHSPDTGGLNQNSFLPT